MGRAYRAATAVFSGQVSSDTARIVSSRDDWNFVYASVCCLVFTYRIFTRVHAMFCVAYVYMLSSVTVMQMRNEYQFYNVCRVACGCRSVFVSRD